MKELNKDSAARFEENFYCVALGHGNESSRFNRVAIKAFIAEEIELAEKRVLMDLYGAAGVAEGFNSGLGRFDIKEYAEEHGIDLTPTDK